MCRRLLLRLGLFLVLFAGICTAAGWVDGFAVPRPTDCAAAAATAGGPGTDADAIARRRAEDTIHNAIAATAAVFVATAFLVVVGTYRRHPGTDGSPARGADAGRCGSDGAGADAPEVTSTPVPATGGAGLGTGRRQRAGRRAGLRLTTPRLMTPRLMTPAPSPNARDVPGISVPSA